MKNFKSLITNAALGYLGLDPEFMIILDYTRTVFISLIMNTIHFINGKYQFIIDGYFVAENSNDLIL